MTSLSLQHGLRHPASSSHRPVARPGRSLAAAVVGALWLAAGTVAGVATPVGTASAQDKKPNPPRLSPAVLKHLRPAQEALQKSEFDAAATSAQAALAVAKEPYDREVSIRILMAAAGGKRDLVTYAQWAEQLLQFETVPAEERTRTLKQLTQIWFQQKDWPKAQGWAKQWADAGGGAEAYELLASTYLVQKDCKGGIGFLEKSVEGREPTETQLRQLNFCYYDLGDKAKRQATMEALTNRFAKREYFIDLLNLYQEQEMDSRAVLHLFRLAYDRDWLTRESEFVEFAGMAVDVGSPAEAEKVYERARTKGVLPAGQRNDQLLKQAKQLAAEDRKTIAALDKEARAGKNGEADVKVGLAYLGLGQYDKAVEATRRGLQPDRIGRVRRVDDAWMTLGVALARLGNHAEAQKAFTEAKADARMSTAADLWTRLGDAAAAAAPAAAPAPAAGA